MCCENLYEFQNSFPKTSSHHPTKSQHEIKPAHPGGKSPVLATLRFGDLCALENSGHDTKYFCANMLPLIVCTDVISKDKKNFDFTSQRAENFFTNSAGITNLILKCVCV